MFKRKTFAKPTETLKLGLNSRAGAEPKIEIAQLDWEGKEINKEAVSKQYTTIESTGKNRVKIRGAYLDRSPFCAYIANEPSDTTTTIQMPAPLIKLSDIDDLNSVPEEAMRLEAKGKIPNFDYVLKDAEGNIKEEVILGENEKYSKIIYNVQEYKQRYDKYGNDITPKENSKNDNANILEDDKGYYVLTTSEFAHVALCSLGFFNGHEVDKAGKEIPNTRGTYIVEGEIGDRNFMKLDAKKSGVSMSIAGRLNKVLNHPIYGVVRSSDVVDDKLVKGTFKYDPRGCTVAIYNSEGEVAETFDDRNAYRVHKFRAKRSNKVEADVLPVDKVLDTIEDNEPEDATPQKSVEDFI